jgi:predicted RNA-binding protein Jag
LQALARNILESPLRKHTIVELNLARFIKRETAVIQTSRGELVEAIEEYRGD